MSSICKKKNIVGKAKNAGKSILWFFNNIFKSIRPKDHLNLRFLQNYPRFLRPYERYLFKTLLEKKKMQVTCPFSFSHNIPSPKQVLIFQLHLFRCLQIVSICTSSKLCCFVYTEPKKKLS